MAGILLASASTDSSNDEPTHEGQSISMTPAVVEISRPTDPESDLYLANEGEKSQVLPNISESSNCRGATFYTGSESGSEVVYSGQDGNGSQSMAQNVVDLDGITDFNLGDMHFSDRAIEFAEPCTFQIGMATYGWDQFRQPFASYPNIDFGMLHAPYIEENWRLPRYDGENSSENDGEEEEEEDVVNQISDRMGSLHLSEDGELRYYGATSNLTLLDDISLLDNRQGPGSDRMRERGQERLDSAGLSQSVSPALVQHLSSLYFAWQDPSFHVVDKDMYERQQTRYQSGYDDSTFFSETLVNSM